MTERFIEETPGVLRQTVVDITPEGIDKVRLDAGFFVSERLLDEVEIRRIKEEAESEKGLELPHGLKIRRTPNDQGFIEEYWDEKNVFEFIFNAHERVVHTTRYSTP